MELDAHDRQGIAFNRLHHAVRRKRYRSESRRQVANRLMVARVDIQAAGAESARQTRAGDDLDAVDDILAAMHDIPRTLRWEVLPQRTAEVDVDQLAAPADADDRQMALHRFVQQQPLPRVAPQVDFSKTRRRPRLVAAWLDVFAAAEQQHVDRRQHPRDNRPVRLRRQHERRVSRPRECGGVRRLHGHAVRRHAHVGDSDHDRRRKLVRACAHHNRAQADKCQTTAKPLHKKLAFVASDAHIL